MTGSVVALSGGVGGAKLALGLSGILPPEQLIIAANTGDDFEHLGLHISPDIDTLIYTLAGMANPDQGWGIQGETWNFLEALSKAGGEDWFQLGDKDLVTHLLRTQALRAGKSLTEITSDLCARYGVQHPILPMSDDPIGTQVLTEEGPLDFQHYFVRGRCAPKVTGFHFKGIEHARLNPQLEAALCAPDLKAVILCPSNPFVSIDPILKTGNCRELLKNISVPVIAVSPLVGGKAIKGPTAKMMQELALPTSVSGIADHYQGLVDGFVIDEADAGAETQLQARGFKTLVTQTVMKSYEDKVALARDCLALIESW